MFGLTGRAERSLHRALVGACPWLSAGDVAELAAITAVPGSTIPSRLFAQRRDGSAALLRTGAAGLDAWSRPLLAARPAGEPRRARLWTFAATLDFTGARLSGRTPLDLAGAALPADLLAMQASFAGDVCLGGLRAPGRVDFSGATFERGAQFEAATFGGPAVFADTTWGGSAQFRRAAFRARASFLRASFRRDGWFREAVFSGPATFAGAVFEGEAGLGACRFGADADFSGTRFGDNAGFDASRFDGDADFRRARFDGRAWFDGTHFEAGSRFALARFSGGAVFDRMSTARPFSPVNDAIQDLERRLRA